jgi:NAD(P)-dependent dehydrogenase (short-subunit alcohol dehydrogenase family)
MTFDKFDLTGKQVLVTGGCSGIGLGMATAVAAAGADVTLWDVNEGNVDLARKTVSQHGTRVEIMTVDVSDPDAVRAAMADVVSRSGRLDAAFANAGIGSRSSAKLMDLDVNDYRRVMDVNLDGVVWTLREAARHMVERADAGDPGGSLVATASIAALEATPRNIAYGASKAAVVSVVKAVAVEVARSGIRVNAILPGFTETGLTAPIDKTDGSSYGDLIHRRVPADRWGTAEDFEGIAVYLASDASRYHTGQQFVIDGGYTIF